jgi:hypothetical protein
VHEYYLTPSSFLYTCSQFATFTFINIYVKIQLYKGPSKQRSRSTQCAQMWYLFEGSKMYISVWRIKFTNTTFGHTVWTWISAWMDLCTVGFWREHAQIMKITNVFFYPISAFAQTNLIIELKLTVYLFSKKLGTDHLTSRGAWEFEYLFFLSHKARFFFHNLTLGYMTKTLKQIFFFLHQNHNIFFSNIGNQNICLEKNHNPPWKLNGR